MKKYHHYAHSLAVPLFGGWGKKVLTFETGLNDPRNCAGFFFFFFHFPSRDLSPNKHARARLVVNVILDRVHTIHASARR